MLFFSGGPLTHDKKLNIKTARNCCGAAVFKDKSLQVPTPSARNGAYACLKKRVLPFIYRKRNGSMAVEAAIVLPLFLFFSVAMLSPIRWLDTQRKEQTEAERICEELSRWAYAEDSEEDVLAVFEHSYQEKIPFFSGVFGGMEMNIAAQRRKWIGLDGKLQSDADGDSSNVETEPMVYVGAGMGRYHLLRDCHYISNQYTAVSVAEAEARRTSDGHRVRPCNSCKPDAAGAGTVYVTAEGEHYHRSPSCIAMVSYVRKVPLREVEHLGACSYCSK